MNEKQKIFALIGIVSIFAFIIIGYATDDWIKAYRGIAWHSFIPLLSAFACGVGWFLFKDGK